jgi:predicted nucleic-acid-binding protein
VIALDTNVLVRFLTQDDAAQAERAARLIEELTPEAPGFVAREVVVELVWVLERSYSLARAEIALALEGLLTAAELEVEAADDVGAATVRYRDEGLGFADQMIAAAGRRAGAAELVTFDRDAARIGGVRLI